MTESKILADRIEDLLPQTQCTKCGYPHCRAYAEAIAQGEASYNQCPPGGAEGIERLATLLGKPVIPLNLDNGVERARPVAFIDENLCIGCTLCMQACPVDAIVGAPKQMHTMVAELCTGCDLCVPPCPVDCIEMIPVTGDKTGWDAWSQQQADAARARHDGHRTRLAAEREAAEARAAAKRAAAASANAPAPAARVAGPAPTEPAVPAVEAVGTAAAPATDAEAKKRAVIQAALERARAKKAENAAQGLGPRNTTDISAATQAQIDEAEARRRRLGIANDSSESTPKQDVDQPKKS
ncbi:electron transport complex subunit RsxB [Paraburkholderia largidicola]|uniref:electron transport complex subunit RsxB n=1 Tax=Paraburkholderia largidicola TaxID=3014751 RepID=UPI0015DAC450|nr:electron transport complex subunit RsxB [Paraburkholderia sp. PGU16]